MGSRDIRGRERKKPRKEAKKTQSAPDLLSPLVGGEVEVIGKGKRRKEFEEEAEREG
jgi:hypothetical protein